jgi:hypothetical protein
MEMDYTGRLSKTIYARQTPVETETCSETYRLMNTHMYLPYLSSVVAELSLFRASCLYTDILKHTPGGYVGR